MLRTFLPWYSQGACENSTVSSNDIGHLRTQFINKNLPSSKPVRIFVDITYSGSSDCLEQNCDVELFNSSYTQKVTMQDKCLFTAESIHLKECFSFDSNEHYSRFYLVLRSHEYTVTVSRVLVYRYECPGSDRLPPTSLLRRPTTPAPVSGSVAVTPNCAENAHLSTGAHDGLMCSSDGTWLEISQINCECNKGYKESENGTTCEGKHSIANLVCVPLHHSLLVCRVFIISPQL